MQRVRRTVPAPADLAVGLVGVPPGADVQLDLRLESVVEGILVSGTATVPLVGECARCLDPIAFRLDVDLQELFVHPEPDGPAAGAGDRDEPEVEDGFVDLVPLLRDAVVLALPLAPVCRDDCPGLCPECGVRLADTPGHTHRQVDPRWAGLDQLVEPHPPGRTAVGRAEES
jgi:uncharacterized protein